MTVPGWELPGYEVVELLGFGSTGEVWRARETATGQAVALKRLRPRQARAVDRLRGAPPAEALRREAALLTAFRHPGVVRLRRVLEEAPGGPVLVLDLAAGGSLASLLALRGHLDPGEVVTTAAPLAEALAAAHAAGLVHGDVTPANVLYDGHGRPLLADLGVARLVGEDLGGAVDGTAEYLDPAVAAGGDPGPASDVFALAAVCFHALGGRAPWHAPTPEDALLLARAGVHDPLERLAPQAPAPLVAAVEAALVADPALRPDAAALAEALTAAAPAAPVRLPVSRVTPGRSPAGAAGLGAPVAPVLGPDVGVLTGRPVVAPPVTRPVRRRHAALPRRRSRRERTLDALQRRPVQLALVLPLLLAVGAAGVLRGGGDDRTPRAAPPTAAPAPTVSATPEPPAPATPVPVPAVLRVPHTSTPATWRLVLAELDRRRSEAFARGDVGLLDGVYGRGSEPWVEDVTALRALTAAGTTARSLRLQLKDVRVESAQPRRVVLRIVDVLPSYEIVDQTGRVVAIRPGRGATAFRVALEPTAGGWRTTGLQRLAGRPQG